MESIFVGDQEFNFRDFEVRSIKGVLYKLKTASFKREFLNKLKSRLEYLFLSYNAAQIVYNLSNNYEYKIYPYCGELDCDIYFFIWADGGRVHKITEQSVKEYVADRTRYYEYMLKWVCIEISSI